MIQTYAVIENLGSCGLRAAVKQYCLPPVGRGYPVSAISETIGIDDYSIIYYIITINLHFLKLHTFL